MGVRPGPPLPYSRADCAGHEGEWAVDPVRVLLVKPSALTWSYIWWEEGSLLKGSFTQRLSTA